MRTWLPDVRPALLDLRPVPSTTLFSTLSLSEIPESVRRKWFYQACAVTWVASGIWKGPLWGAYFKKLHCPDTQACKCPQGLTLWWAAVIREPERVVLTWRGCWGDNLVPQGHGELCCLLEVLWKWTAVPAPGKLAQSTKLRCRSCWVTKGRLGRCCVPQSEFLLVTVNHRSIARRATLLFPLSLSSCCHQPPP